MHQRLCFKQQEFYGHFLRHIILPAKRRYLQQQKEHFEYILDHFIDKEFGGVYWSVDYKGNTLDTKKQIYALSFGIYGLSEFYIASKNERQ